MIFPAINMDFHDFPRISMIFLRFSMTFPGFSDVLIPSPCPRRGRALRHLGCRCNGRGRAGAEVGSCDLNCWQLTISRFFSRGHIWVVHIMHSIVPYYTILYITYIHIYNYIYIYYSIPISVMDLYCETCSKMIEYPVNGGGGPLL